MKIIKKISKIFRGSNHRKSYCKECVHTMNCEVENLCKEQILNNNIYFKCISFKKRRH